MLINTRKSGLCYLADIIDKIGIWRMRKLTWASHRKVEKFHKRPIVYFKKSIDEKIKEVNNHQATVQACGNCRHFASYVFLEPTVLSHAIWLANMWPQSSHPTLVRMLPVPAACYQRYSRAVSCGGWCGELITSSKTRTVPLAYMCRRFDLNDTFNDVGRMQKVVWVERPWY